MSLEMQKLQVTDGLNFYVFKKPAWVVRDGILVGSVIRGVTSLESSISLTEHRVLNVTKIQGAWLINVDMIVETDKLQYLVAKASMNSMPIQIKVNGSGAWFDMFAAEGWKP